MDAMKVLGGLLSQRAGRPGTGGGLLGQVLNGVAAATATTNNVGQPTSGIESLVRATMMAINLDNERELQYLRNLAIALRIPPENCNQLHANYGMRGVF
jgi:hypothetical protein